MLSRHRIAAVLPAGLLALACTATAVRRYDEPLAYTRFAAEEACATAGFDLTRVEANEIQGERPAQGGLLGQGDEHIRVRLRESGSSTEVEIVSRKRFLTFRGSRHQHERVARYLDELVVEDADLRERIVGATR